MFAPFWHWVGRRRTRPVVWPPACYPAVSIPYFYSAHPQRALPLKGGGSYSQLCLSIPRWSFKRAHSPAERERERDSKKGETAEIEIVWGVMELDRSQSIQPKIPQPIETSCPCYRFPPPPVCRLPPPAGRRATATATLVQTTVSNCGSRIADIILQQLSFI